MPKPATSAAVHDYVEAAEGVLRRGDGGAHLLLVGQVDFDRQEPGGVGAVKRRRETLDRAGGRRDVIAAAQELGDEVQAEASQGS